MAEGGYAGANRLGLWKRLAAVVGIWVTAAALNFTQNIIQVTIEGEQPDISELFLFEVLTWQFWTPVTLLLLHLISVWSTRRADIPRTAIKLALIGLLVAPGQSAYQAAIVRWIFSESQSWVQLFQIFLSRTSQFQLFIYAGVAGVVVAVDYARRLRDRERRTRELETRLARSQLDALKMQLHPHFLFNTLQAISALIGRDDRAARRTVTRLGDLLRMTLDNSDTQVVTLEQELHFLRLYLEIEQTRFPDRLAVHFDTPPNTLGLEVPNLLLQPIVENSIRYAVEPRSEGGHIWITSRVEGDRLELRIADDGPGLSAQPAGNGRGIGLANTRERLAKLYGDDHEFRQSAADGGGLETVVSLPVRRAVSS